MSGYDEDAGEWVAYETYDSDSFEKATESAYFDEEDDIYETEKGNVEVPAESEAKEPTDAEEEEEEEKESREKYSVEVEKSKETKSEP